MFSGNLASFEIIILYLIRDAFGITLGHAMITRFRYVREMGEGERAR
jgi:hypothetical protein